VNTANVLKMIVLVIVGTVAIFGVGILGVGSERLPQEHCPINDVSVSETQYTGEYWVVVETRAGSYVEGNYDSRGEAREVVEEIKSEQERICGLSTGD